MPKLIDLFNLIHTPTSEENESNDFLNDNEILDVNRWKPRPNVYPNLESHKMGQLPPVDTEKLLIKISPGFVTRGECFIYSIATPVCMLLIRLEYFIIILEGRVALVVKYVC